MVSQFSILPWNLRTFANFANSAFLSKNPKTMLILPNYAKNYTSTIDKSLVGFGCNSES